jgi:NAD(P)-dependent dehydrogenase (short-subunit alcohol dehydrogenase family)
MTMNSSRVWLVTGASSGFGRAIAEAAVAAGDVVVAAARRTAGLEDLVGAHPDRVEAVALDVTDTAAVAAVVTDVRARYGRIDVLVNNAGRGHVGAAEETTDQELRDLFDLHVHGPAALVRAVLPGMRERGSGAIVQMSSFGGQVPTPGSRRTAPPSSRWKGTPRRWPPRSGHWGSACSSSSRARSARPSPAPRSGRARASPPTTPPSAPPAT